MTGRSTLTSSFIPSLPSLSKRNHSNFAIRLRISCNFRNSEADEEFNFRQSPLHLLNLSLTLTVISASLAQPSLASGNKLSERKRSSKRSDALTPLELEKWSQGLPTVSNRLPYTEILDLRREGKLKHIIKPPSVGLKQRPEVVLAVLDDSRVVRIVLPSSVTDPKFWSQWDELKIDGLCMNAYSPPLKIQNTVNPYLEFFGKIPAWFFSLSKRPKPQSKKVLELKRAREEIVRSRKEEIDNMKREREMMEKAIKVQRKMEEKRMKREIQQAKHQESLQRAAENSRRMSTLWGDLASDSTVTTSLGFLFFYIFYRTVVLSYRKQKKDYEDRLKIQQAEAEEKKKIRDLEREMEGIEGGDEEEEEGQKSEENQYMKMAMQFMKSGARVRRIRSKRVPQYLEPDVDVKFSDVAGLGKIRLELEEIVKFFTHGDMYRRRGIKIPGGILLCGPPGVGKTLLAKAVAGEAGVNFFSISASQFVEIYVGVGASRVRALYQEARENAPSVVFIDELDAVGRARGLIKGSGGQERDATLNQLLVCLDGFEGKGEVITIASTNRPDILDPALVRPGRFDRKIHIPIPGFIGRIEILKVHARKKPIDPDVDYMAVASVTDGMVGAELANIIEVAAINMMRDGRTEITTDDLLQAAQMEELGMLDRKERSLEMWKQVAVNQAAVAVAAVNFPDLKSVEFITITPRAGTELGYVRIKMDDVKFKNRMLSRQSLIDKITVDLAPRAADELWYGEGQLSTIWAKNADNARSAARTFVLSGLSDKDYGLSNFWVSEKINGIDEEALRILSMCYDRAKKILRRNWKLMDVVVDELVQKKSLTKKEFLELVEMHGSLEPSPPTIVDLRLAKRSKIHPPLLT